jgi:hypothetical protein
VLDQLGAFLELSTPLQPDYRRFAHTGEPGFGDPSQLITTGRVTSEAREHRTSVSVPRPLLTRLQTAYDFWSGALRKNCPVIDPAAASSAGQDEAAS